MLTTKLFLPLGFLLLSLSPIENTSSFFELKSQNYYSVVTRNTLENQKSQDAGKEIYADFCIQCHGANGKGDNKSFPPLDGSDWLIKKRTQSIRAVKFGQTGEIIVNKIKFNNVMPPMGLSNKEVADVMNYIMNSWSNKQTTKVTENEVEKIK
jgi:mono/diheme cytochrome c family protein